EARAMGAVLLLREPLDQIVGRARPAALQYLPCLHARLVVPLEQSLAERLEQLGVPRARERLRKASAALLERRRRRAAELLRLPHQIERGAEIAGAEPEVCQEREPAGETPHDVGVLLLLEAGQEQLGDPVENRQRLVALLHELQDVPGVVGYAAAHLEVLVQ